MTWKLIKDIGSKEYKVGDLIPDSLGKRLHHMYVIGHSEEPHVEKVVAEKEPVLVPFVEEVKEEDPLDVNKDGKVDIKDVIEVAKRTVSRKRSRKKSTTKKK